MDETQPNLVENTPEMARLLWGEGVFVPMISSTIPSPPPYPPPPPVDEGSRVVVLEKMNERLTEEMNIIYLEMDRLLLEKKVNEKNLTDACNLWRERYTRMMLRCFHQERSMDWFCSRFFLGEAQKPECTICHSVVAHSDEVIGLQCKHWFCETCWFQWENVQQTCPLCRTEVHGDYIVFRSVHESCML